MVLRMLVDGLYDRLVSVSMPCVPVAPSTNVIYTVSLAELLAVTVTLVASVAEDAVPVRLAVIVPAEKLPDPSLNTMVELVLVLTALDVTVNVPPSEFTEPDIPLPDVAPCCT